MNIDFYERVWMWAAGVIIALFIAVIGMTTVAYGLHPPSHVETIEPSKVFADPRFSKVGQLVELPDGGKVYVSLHCVAELANTLLGPHATA